MEGCMEDMNSIVGVRGRYSPFSQSFVPKTISIRDQTVSRSGNHVMCKPYIANQTLAFWVGAD